MIGLSAQARLEETARILKKVDTEQRRASASGAEEKLFGDKQLAGTVRAPAVIRHDSRRAHLRSPFVRPTHGLARGA